MSIQQQEKLQSLLSRYVEGSIGETEVEELSRFLKDEQYDDIVKQILTDLSAHITPAGTEKEEMQKMISRVKEVSANMPMRERVPYTRWAAAAVLVLMFGVGGYFLFYGDGQPALAPVTTRYSNDIPPGGNKAILTLADGSTITLDDAGPGALAQQGSTQIVKTGTGSLAYNSVAGDGVVHYNTLTTPFGGRYQVVLPDGSRVWLNAGSSLRYPTAFAGNSREVELSGEAYFEVTGNAAKPFRVRAQDGTSVEVLGTHFNVSAYAGESQSTTTLLEGAVQVSKGQGNSRLAPGQQAIAGNTVQVLANADINAAVAWKNGLFMFNDADIETIMKQLSRWYDIEVVYEGGPVKELFNATIPRDVPVSKVFELLELTNLIHFKIDGKKVTVIP
ncbi:FecR family protein [Chitinophaga sp. XS-30]|uniref:FecR family protein n=1 Tax=Chitinophaga sp. XS-30 TaxID=2604421 RepID=UPI0011DD1E89|nr:FecR family protein [Chitinophaga sp. XS-30]QEH41816.1 DUF4974 domain-containing protein [Chitinophaga sp. XS-30]